MARSGRLVNLTTEQLAAELGRRRKLLERLRRAKASLEKRIAAIDARMAELTGAVSRRSGAARRRRAHGRPLAAFVQEVLAGVAAGLSVTAIEKAVLAAGYPTTASSIYHQVAKVLGTGRFARLGRGVYALKAPARTPRA